MESVVHGHVAALKKLSGDPFPDAKADHWQRFPLQDIEGLRNAVLGADLDAVQMAGRKIGGSLAFSTYDGVILSSGFIAGNAMARGVLSDAAVTVGIVLSQVGGFRVCLRQIPEGTVGILLPGCEVDVLCAPGSMYVTATLDLRRLEDGLGRRFLQSVVHSTPLAQEKLKELREALLRVHLGEETEAGVHVGRTMLRAIISHYANDRGTTAASRPSSYETIVRLAQQYIDRHLASPISITDITTACGSSRRTLYRAFLEVLGDTPNHYLRRLRLHRIRRDLMAGDQLATISASAKKWGIAEHGRMSGWYQELFGEKPSATVAAQSRRAISRAWL